MCKKRIHRFLLCLSILLPTTVTRAANDSYSDDDWRRVLSEFVDQRGLVDYEGLAASPETLDRYVDQIARISPKSHPEIFADRAAELAYYVNAYNALVIHGVLEKGPDISSVWGRSGTGFGFFVRQKVIVGGEKVSLKKLEDEDIRAGYRDPRIHAALNCASRGCPRLPRRPFTAESLDQELDAAMTEFVGEERNCRPEPKNRTVTLSKIFDWFEKDFLDYERAHGNSRPTVMDYVNRYRSEEARIPRDYRVEFAKYDKSLNRQP